MRTAYISHPACHQHDTGAGHPERRQRLAAIEDRLVASGLADLLRHIDAPEATLEQLGRVHTREYLESVQFAIPARGLAHLDPDTVVSSESLRAAKRAAGAVVTAVDHVARGDFDNALCCVRPPGHHAESARAMGFCLFNNIAVGATHALEEHGFRKLAIVDFDVHQGNGTEEIFRDEERILFCSTFQYPFYPNTPLLENTARRINVPLAASARSAEFRSAVSNRWIPALRAFRPEMILVSAGFDAHSDDDMSQMSLTDDDYRWVTEQIVAVGAAVGTNRIVSTLEGGYELDSLARSVEAHLRVLMGLH